MSIKSRFKAVLNAFKHSIFKILRSNHSATKQSNYSVFRFRTK
nr:MAG TPA: hypothetical protein [Caudoviricetes sp.]